MEKGKFHNAILERIYLTKKLRSVIDRVIDDCLAERCRITGSQFFILTAIEEEPEMPQYGIARYLGLTSAAVSKQFGALERKKLIRRNAGADRRENILSLSPAGRRLLGKAKTELAGRLRHIFGEAKPHDALENEHLKMILAKVEAYSEKERK